MAAAPLVAPLDVQLVARIAEGAGRRDVKRPCCRRVWRGVCAAVLDIATILGILATFPVLACVALLVCLPALVDYLRHPRREYLDSLSATYINNVPEAVIHCVIVYTERVPSEALLERFYKVYLSGATPEFEKFRQRIVRSRWAWPYWADASATFDLSYHTVTVREAVTKAELEERVAAMQGEQLDLERPVWQVFHFENYTDESGTPCSASLLRLHHAWADGLTGLRVLLQGASPNAPPQRPTSQRADRRQRVGCIRIVRYALATFRKLLFMPQDRPSALKAKRHMGVSSTRAVAWSTLSGTTVADLKDLGSRLGGASVNDVLFAALSGALRSYTRGVPEEDRPQRDPTAAVWVSGAPLKHIYASFQQVPLVWGNVSLGVVYIPLPAGARAEEMSPQTTLTALRQRTGDPALLVEAMVAHYMQGLVGFLPGAISPSFWKLVANKVTLSMSNVPGPQFPLSWCGAPVRGMLFFVPPTGTVSLFVTIATWNGEVNVGMAMDGELISRERLGEVAGPLFEEQISMLRQHAKAAAM